MPSPPRLPRPFRPVAANEPAAGLITESLAAGVAGQPGFATAVNALRGPTDVPTDLAALAREFARVFLVYGRAQPIALVHAVTAPATAPIKAELARPLADVEAEEKSRREIAQAGPSGYLGL